MAHEYQHRPHVLLLNWRDTGHPEGGGSERYLERMARGLAARGYRVTIQCAAYPGAPADEWRDGVWFRRRGNRFTVYPRAMAAVVALRPDVVVDVQNGIPFFSRLVAACPVVVLVHHVHREQWRPAVGRVLGRLGWWIESRLAPRLYRTCRYVTVSEVTRAELGTLGIGPDRVTVIRPGLDPPPARTEPVRPAAPFVPPAGGPGTDADPVLVVVGRLVPHKQIEHAIDALAQLTERWPKLCLEVVGQGWWRENLLAHTQLRRVEDRVTFHGWVDEQDKHELLARATVHLCPSVKEGWGIAIMEAAAHGVPSVAYRTAGGVKESIVDNETGVLVQDLPDLVRQLDRLLSRPAERAAMGAAGRRRAALFGWERGVDAFERALVEVSAGRSRRHRPTGRASARPRS